MRLEIVTAPDIAEGGFADALLGGHGSTTPLGHSFGLDTQGGLHNRLDFLRPHRWFAAPARVAISQRLCGPPWAKRARHSVTVGRPTCNWISAFDTPARSPCAARLCCPRPKGQSDNAIAQHVSTRILLKTMEVGHRLKRGRQEKAIPPSLIPLRPGPAGVGEKASEWA